VTTWAISACLIVPAACGSSATSDPAGTMLAASPTGAPPASTVAPEAVPSMPVTLTDATGRAVTVRSVERIIPVDGDLAEIVFALGLGDRVVATDLSATYPPEADAKPEIGYQRALAAEPILSFSPTIVLATPLAGPAEVIDQLRPAVPTVLIDAPDTLEGPAQKVRAVAAALGVPGRGEQLARQTQEEIDAAAASAPKGAAPIRVAALYLRGERVQQIFGPGSGIHVLLRAAGVTDIGELLGVKDNQPITAEALLRERPDALIVTTTGLESVGGIDKLLAFPALSRTPVATSRRVYAYEDQYLYGFGPRTGQLLAQLIREIHQTT
jgi:iron complex transport system substrate-binding protein